MVKTNYKGLHGMSPSLRPPSSSSGAANPSENGMEGRRLSVTPGSGGSSGGYGGRSSGNTSSRRRRRMSDLSSGTRLMSQFNAAAADGGNSGPRSFVRLEHVLDEWRRSHIRVPSLPETPPTPCTPTSHLARLLFLGSPMRSPADDDDVLIMDGVLVDSSGPRMASNIRRSASFSGPFASGSMLGSSDGSSCASNGQVNGLSSSGGGSGYGSNTSLLFGFLGSGGGSRFGSNDQFSPGWEEPRRSRMQAMRGRISDVTFQGSGRSSTGSNMQGSPISPYLFPPPLQGPRAVSSYTDAAVSVRPPASYSTPPRATVSAPRPSPWTPPQPETEPAPPPPMPFAWPPTAEEDASFEQLLYGATARRRLPVFEAICPDPEEGEE